MSPSPERLAEDTELKAAALRAHADFFANFTRRQWERLTGDGREAAIRELTADIENVRTAWGYWVGKRDLEQLGKFVDSLWRDQGKLDQGQQLLSQAYAKFTEGFTTADLMEAEELIKE